MNFISSEFAILLIVTVTLASWSRGRTITYVILGSSIIFYGWWNPPYLLLLAAVIVISWAGALAIERWPAPSVLWTVVIAELALLVYFKYTGFIVRNIQAAAALAGHPLVIQTPRVLLPAGISFMTFQGVAYAVDVYRREVPAERSFVSVALFKSFFPQLVAGPIERATHLMPQLKRLEIRSLRDASFQQGTFMVLKGVLLKFVIADNMSVVVDTVYGNVAGATPFDVVLAVLAFSVQIYCDFYGYTMIALGSARMLGVELVQNFAHPYLATNIQEFWRRWHISLSQWFRDYLYIPLGGSRVSRARHILNLLIVMFAVGLWHGANWTFVLWGTLHGAMLAAYSTWRRAVDGRKAEWMPAGMHAVVGWAVTFVLVTLVWIPFRSPDLATQTAVLAKLGQWALHPRNVASSIYGADFYVAIACAFVVLELWDAFAEIENALARLPAVLQAATVFAMCAATYLGPAKDIAFLYFQF